MINKRLIQFVPSTKKYIIRNVLLQFVALIANIGLMAGIASLLQALWAGHSIAYDKILLLAIISISVRMVCTIYSTKMAYLSAKEVKQSLRSTIYQKLLQMGSAYKQSVQSSAVVQMAVEGVEQLESYFGQYLPQFFYAIMAPLLLFIVLSFVNFYSALVLFICVPLIPITIIAIQKFAKKLLARYWGQYAALGDSFLENLQGLNTSKIYKADDFKQKEMNAQAEHFRKITMKVLTMQLNSITVMDIVAYGGAGLGMVLAVTQLQAGNTSVFGAIWMILLAADFFLPMRLLGSYFHIAMNGMAAADKIFALLDTHLAAQGTEQIGNHTEIHLQNLTFAYADGKEALYNINLQIPSRSFVALVGESGCGKSTLAGLLMGRNKGYTGIAQIGNIELHNVTEQSLRQAVCYIGHQSYLLKGTVRENLQMAKPDASEQEMWQALEAVHMADFLHSQDGLDTQLLEKACNLSGGQCQRLALARALLHNAAIYIFDEATSNIDVESELAIVEQIKALAKYKAVLFISHRLANTQEADCIYVLENGKLQEHGKHSALLEQNGYYAKLWNAQQALENFKGGQQ
ncbi:MAG: ABC transporter ATP-binding protein/permease [Eubacteriales bacterium]|nr:ABC transporter ATP-binding protein/permease [Eubacteriales bacterium]